MPKGPGEIPLRHRLAGHGSWLQRECSGVGPRSHPRARVPRGFAAAGLAGLVLSACGPSPDRPLDPERHRPALRKLEIVLYRPTPPEPEDRKAIEDAAAALAKEIGGSPGTRAGEATRAIEAFSAKIGGRGEERFETVSLVDARAEWEELRGRHFSPAAWFGESTPFLEQAQGGAAARAPSAAAVQLAQDAQFVLEQMAGIVDRAEVYLMGLGTCAEAEDYERAREEWEDWKRSHENDVARVKDSLDLRYERALGSAFRDILALSAPLKGGPCNATANNDGRLRVSRARAMLMRARDSVSRVKAPG